MSLKSKLSKKGFYLMGACVLGTSFIFAGCSGDTQTTDKADTTAATTLSDSTQAQTASGSTEATQKNVKLQVVDKEGNTTEYEEVTNSEFLRGVLDEISEDADFTYSGTESEYGLFIDQVNGERADYTLDGAYWSIYVNDEYANYGVDAQPVNDGDTFALKYEAANK